MIGSNNSKRCHYCDGEVDEGAMICKHCGKRLMPPGQRAENSQQRHKVVLALGTNKEQKANMDKATRLLEETLTDIRQSRELWTEPIGMVSESFLNKMMSGYTYMSLADLTQATKAIEKRCGRTADSKSRGEVRMDIDIMGFDGERLHGDDWARNYIKTLHDEIKE